MEDPHPPDCSCCRVVIDRRGPPKRARVDADLSTFLPVGEGVALAEPEEGELEGEEEELEGEEEPTEEPAEEDALIHDALFKSFETHVERLDAARLRRIEALSFKSALEDDGKDEVNEDATQDDIDGLGLWLAGDEFQGDVNMRTLQKLLTRVDQRGFERSAQQLEARPPLHLVSRCLLHVCVWCVCVCVCVQFHVAFMKAAARVIYRGSWETERPAIMKRYGWETSNSEVLIRCAHAHTHRHTDTQSRCRLHRATHARAAVCAVPRAVSARRFRAPNAPNTRPRTR